MDQPEFRNSNDAGNQHHEDIFNKKKKMIETYSIISVLCLIIAIILISFNLRLFAGCFVIGGAAIFINILRKFFDFISYEKELFLDASESNRQKENVIADFSHRIREPLNHLVLIADALINSGLQKKQKELLETFVASTNNMVSTVNELTMESAGSLTFLTRKPIKYNLLSTIRNTIELFNISKKGNLDFILSKKESHDFDCFGDPIILKQILLDLFNSIESKDSDHTKKVALSIRKEEESETGWYLSLRIQIDENIILIDRDGSAGYLASRLIQFANGKYIQEPGNNCTVLTIKMPFRSPDKTIRKQAVQNETGIPGSETRSMIDLKELNVLLVEDNLINQKITNLTIGAMVKSIETALNGKEALEKLETGKFDLILMDIQMPVMNGLIAAENIRELEKGTGTHLPIIAMTADALLGDMEKCLSAGIDEYISKPFLPDQLIEKIRKVL